MKITNLKELLTEQRNLCDERERARLALVATNNAYILLDKTSYSSSSLHQRATDAVSEYQQEIHETMNELSRSLKQVEKELFDIASEIDLASEIGTLKT